MLEEESKTENTIRNTSLEREIIIHRERGLVTVETTIKSSGRVTEVDYLLYGQWRDTPKEAILSGNYGLLSRRVMKKRG